MEYYYGHYKDPDMGAWARDCLNGPSPVPGSSHHRELASALEHSMTNLDALHAKMRTLEINIMRQRATLAPIRRIPSEILIHIFHLTLEKNSEDLIAGHWRQPMAIAAVCRTWRSVALNTPQFWTSCKIRDNPTEKFLFTFQCWLARSGNVPLDVNLVIDDGRDSSIILRYFPSSVLQRMERVSISVLYNPGLDPLFHFLEGAPQLHTLLLKGGGMAQLHHLPFLQKLKLESTHGIPRLRCPSLIFLILSGISCSSNDFKALSNAAPMLKSVLLTNCFRNEFSHDVDESEGGILFPSLQELVFNRAESRLLLDFFDSRNLQQLRVKLGYRFQFIVSFPPLKRLLKLEIDFDILDNQDLTTGVLGWLEQACEVEELLIRTERENDWNELINCVLSQMIARNLCPVLREMTMECCFTDSLNLIPQFRKQRYALHRLLSGWLEANCGAHGPD